VRVGSRAGRAVLVSADGKRAVDVARASDGRFGPDPLAVYEDWDAFVGWAAGRDDSEGGGEELRPSELDAPSPAPRQVFGIGLNYRDHAAESGLGHPDRPPVFTKFVSSFAGPVGELALPAGTVDWEVELVVVIGRRAHRVARADAWTHVAGFTVGQDYSERTLQMAGPAPQFSMGKSYPGFAPQGPWLVTLEEFADPADLPLTCTLNGETVQSGRTSQMIVGVDALIETLSAVTPLLPGDVIFTGTPAGVGMARTPPRFLQPGDEVVTTIEGIGTLRQTCVAAG
jgi:2-keto-4-pentenoate hydratase/2-oxohepta-3-ene-1,7-dioic acid hydratase in catechol pathway